LSEIGQAIGFFNLDYELEFMVDFPMPISGLRKDFRAEELELRFFYLGVGRN
jgi:hypothetical protein